MATPQPRGLGAGGKKLWTSVAGTYELEVDEVILLRQACLTLDTIDELQRRLDAADVLDERYGGRVHPCVPELRQQRLALSRLLKALNVGDADEQPKRQRRRWPNGNYGIRGAGIVVRRIQPAEPPLELESSSLFAVRRGLPRQTIWTAHF